VDNSVSGLGSNAEHPVEKVGIRNRTDGEFWLKNIDLATLKIHSGVAQILYKHVLEG